MKKKGEEGASVDYMTRTAAVRKLQLSLSDFRKLCILKGVYPREPSKKVKGRDKTYYYTKDIMFLMHDPVLSKLREQKTWRKRIAKAKGRKQAITEIRRIEKQKPKYSLIPIVKERYPSFTDALRDLNDPLCMIHLFAHLSANNKITPQRIESSRRLSLEFQSYIIRTRALKKTFLSIKGIYYQAEVSGVKVTWLSPYKFCQELPKFVDYHVMLNFLEFYETLLKFVNYKLFHSIGLDYPPVFDPNKEDHGEGLFSVILQTKSQALAAKSSNHKPLEKNAKSLPEKLEKQIKNVDDQDMDEEESENDEENENEEEEATVFQSNNPEAEKLSEFQNLFSGFVFFLSRETPKESLEFVIRSFGGEVTWQGEFAPYPESSEKITHHVIDRDIIPKKVHGRAYVQPQWVYDTINAGVLLPVEQYGIDCKLPPHLSPFIDDEAEGYVPKRSKELKRLIANAKGEIYDASDDEEGAEQMESDEEVAEEVFTKELEAEQKGITFSESKKQPIEVEKKPTKKQIEKQEEAQRQEIAHAMIPSRRRRQLYEKMKQTQKQKEEKNKILLEKAELLKQQKAQKQGKA